MSTLSISRRFDVAAPASRVWDYLTTPELVVTCLPGAALVSSAEDGRTHEGTVTVKLGALSVSYRGTAEFQELDGAARRMHVRARGREKGGAGSAEMTMQAEVAANGAAASEVVLEAGVSVTGRIVTLGRGMIEIVSEQMLSDFASCLSQRLASNPDEAAADKRSPAGSGSGTEAVSALRIFWRALKSWIRRLLGRG